MKHKSALATSRLRRVHLASVSIIALCLTPVVTAHADPGNTVISTAVTGPENWYGGTFTVTSTGSISGSGTGVNADSSDGAFSNAGTITGDTTGVFNEGSIPTMTNDGTIQGAGAGFDNGGSVTTFTNNATGIIQSTGAHSAGLQNTGTITSLINAGIIRADPTGMNGIYNPSGGAIGSITNSGTIKGSLYAISSDGTLGPIENSGLIAGNIKNLGTAADLVINGGSSLMGTITGYDEISVGAINGGTRDVVFNSGKLLLNSHVTVSGNSLRNTGADLRVDNEITVTGNYVQTGGSLISGVNSSSSYGQLTVTGNASLTDTALILFDIGGNMETGQTYTILNAGGTLTATNLTSSSSGFETTFEASGQNLIVTLGDATGISAKLSYEELGRQISEDMANIGKAMDQLATGTSDSAIKFQTNLLPLLANISDKSKISILKGMGRVRHGVIFKSMSLDKFVDQYVNRILFKPGTKAAGQSGVAAGDGPGHATLWGKIIGGSARQESGNGAMGFDAHSYGFVTGLDFDLTDEWTGGVALGWVRSDANSSLGNAGSSADSYQAAFHGTWSPQSFDGRLHVSGVAALGFSQNEQSHVIGFFGVEARSEYDSWQYYANAELGYDFPIADNTVLTPYIGVKAIYFTDDGYTETGAGLLNTTMDEYSDSTIRHDIGVKISTSMDSSLGEVTPILSLGWLHDYDDSPASATGALGGVTFTAPMSAISQNGLAIGAGLEIARSDTLTLGFEYGGDIRSDYESHTGSLKASIRF